MDKFWAVLSSPRAPQPWGHVLNLWWPRTGSRCWPRPSIVSCWGQSDAGGWPQVLRPCIGLCRTPLALASPTAGPQDYSASVLNHIRCWDTPPWGYCPPPQCPWRQTTRPCLCPSALLSPYPEQILISMMLILPEILTNASAVDRIKKKSSMHLKKISFSSLSLSQIITFNKSFFEGISLDGRLEQLWKNY